MHTGLTGADERADVDNRIRICRNFGPLVSYFIGAAVFLSVHVALFPA